MYMFAIICGRTKLLLTSRNRWIALPTKQIEYQAESQLRALPLQDAYVCPTLQLRVHS